MFAGRLAAVGTPARGFAEEGAVAVRLVAVGVAAWDFPAARGFEFAALCAPAASENITREALATSAAPVHGCRVKCIDSRFPLASGQTVSKIKGGKLLGDTPPRNQDQHIGSRL